MSSLMAREARESGDVVAQLLTRNAASVHMLAASLRTQNPQHIVTIARGSSDHAASFFAYLVMTQLGRWVTSLPMSVFTLENAPLTGANVAAFAFSQSGRSPDLIVPTQTLRARGATTVAIVNVEDSPLAAAAEVCIPVHAGVEHSVAATKSFMAQLAAGLHIVSEWSEDNALATVLHALPAALNAAAQHDWSHAMAPLQSVERLLVLSRGAGLAVAQEAALKLKETCGIQAEAFSGAEVKHGPMALIDEGYPLLIFAPRGAAQAELVALADAMHAWGAHVFLAAPGVEPASNGVTRLATTPAPHPLLDALTITQSFYGFVEALARARGRDPDQPRHLSKVTLTR